MAINGSKPEHVGERGMQAYRAPSLAQPHRARQALRDAYEGKIGPLLGFYMALPNVMNAKVAAQLEADFVWVDWEHSPLDVETMTEVVQTIQYVSEGATMAFVRVPNHDHANIGFALDAGASAVIVPQVDTVAQAQHVVSSSKFGKVVNGTRSAPPARWVPGLSTAATLDPSSTIWENLNKQAALIIQIESEVGVKNLDDILTEVGSQIDVVWIGLIDLRVSMGYDGIWGDEPDFLRTIRLCEQTLSKHGKPTAGPCFDGNWARAANKTFTVVSGDWLALANERETIRNARTNLPATDKRQNWSSTSGVAK
ncbi:hypothetical protein QQS21_001902 [Conoideocrella luteorostrata]|uniref:HpcH/HpaI aldolase/citrate lyase domain-containing protein n=1 Tax=Conoideocrella luteorostrata TaxID=1105319 RepID=A0AAJ0CZ78_9HYPO|nr:hypothetical protein QQS21_001902 [Conoideocrella luteorostrata]